MILRNKQGPRLERDGVRRVVSRADRSLAARLRQQSRPSIDETQTQDSEIQYAIGLGCGVDDVDLSADRFFADIPSLPTGDGGVGPSSSSFMDIPYDPRTFFGSCVEEYVVSLDQDDDAQMTERDTGVASQEPAAEPSVQHDAPAREDPLPRQDDPQQEVPAQPAAPVAPQPAAPVAPQPAPRDPALPPGEILRSYVDHRGYYIWTHPEEDVRPQDVLTVRRRATQIRRYDPFIYDGPDSWFVRAAQSGLTGLRDIDWDGVDGYTVSAFMDHWQPETNSFHFPWGEMTITLHDVACLLGLPITGPRLRAEHSDDQVRGILRQMFGYTEADAARYRNAGGFPVLEMLDYFGATHGGRRLSSGTWLREGAVFDIADQAGLHRLTTAYLSNLIAATLFVDKSQNLLRWDVIALVLDVDRAATLAWGAGVLAHLYRDLGKGTRGRARQIDGCLTLLQVSYVINIVSIYF